jgi:hypothetical protein
MYVPDAAECTDTTSRNMAQLKELSKSMRLREYGLFVDGDKETLYLLQRSGKNECRFVKAYPISTSRENWSNEADSAGTPLGLHRIASMHAGFLGEVLSDPDRSDLGFALITVRRHGKAEKKRFVRSLISEGGDAVAEIITRAMLVVGKKTPPSRGIFLHGTNRTDRLGEPDSGGCIRMSNVDITNLAHSVRASRNGTSLYIHATRPPKQVDHGPSEIQKRNLFEKL